MGGQAEELRARAAAYGQEHVFRFWDALDEHGRRRLLSEIASVDFALMRRLAETWLLTAPEPERFQEICPVRAIPPGREAPGAMEAWDAGEEALRSGRVGLFLVAGGQGTRLGFDGPKGAYPVGRVSRKSLFEFHAEKIHNLQQRYSCVLPWYIMVSAENAVDTKSFFRKFDFFGLRARDVFFLEQEMIPSMDEAGRFLLKSRDALAMNPNGHGGSIPAMVKHGVLDDARTRGVDLLSYFQVDNVSAQVADALFIGYHVLRNAEMSSKVVRKREPREPVGIHCLCDGEYRIIEYTELDLYPQLLETDADGRLIHYAGNPAIHILSAEFVSRIEQHFEDFPWHCAHRKVACLDARGDVVEPSSPNAYKFETFVFDALRFTRHDPVALEIVRSEEFTPFKNASGDDSVESASAMMAEKWAGWLEAAGHRISRDASGQVNVPVEISPRFALDQDEFVRKAAGTVWPPDGAIAIDGFGQLETVISPD